jgi:predicted GNAT family N-acyltransferase
MLIECVARDSFTDRQTQALERLWSAVYPPEVLATLPSRSLTWAPPQWSVLVWDQDELVARVGLVVREIDQDGVIKRIGGIGGVMTHPARRGQGLAGLALQEAVQRFNVDFQVAFALLFCGSQLIAFYERYGWKPFLGELFVEQPQSRIAFSDHNPMVFDIREPAPLQGTIDLRGLPW